MAQREVIWTETAARQRREILKYWSDRNKSASYSEKLIKLIQKKISLIVRYPESGKNVQFTDTKTSAMGHYSIYYKIINDEIIITAFWDNRQDPVKLLRTLKNQK